MRDITFITGSRAEWGLLEKVYRQLEQMDNKDFRLSLFVTGSHLCTEFGETWRHINVPITKKIECVLSSDTPFGITSSMALGALGFGMAFQERRPDLLVVLGDRYEIFAAVSAAHVFGIPVAHIHGGEVTEGSIDDGFRHSITKMSHLHFVAAENYRRRVIQLGEHPRFVHLVGALGADGLIKRGHHDPTNFFIVAYYGDPAEIDHIEKVLNRRKANFVVAQGSHDMACYMGRENAYVVPRDTYLKDLAHADAIIGNSSSGIIEAPALGVPSINIGYRQKGRLLASSVLDIGMEELDWAIDKALDPEWQENAFRFDPPYVGGNVAEQIAEKLLNSQIERKEFFYDLL